MLHNSFCGRWRDSSSLTANIPSLTYPLTLKNMEWMQIPLPSELFQFYTLFLLLGPPGIIPIIISLDLPQIILTHGGQHERASQ